MKMSYFVSAAITTALFIAITPWNVEAARILTVAPFFASSHAKVIQSVMLHLAKKGHDVTVIAGNLVKNPPPNYHQIPVDYSPYIEKTDPNLAWKQRDNSVLDQLFFAWNETLVVTEILFQSPKLREFIEKDNSKFDLVMVEIFFDEIMYMFAHKYKAPLVLIDTSSMKRQIEDIMGNPAHVSYVPFEYLKVFGDFTILQRFANWFIGMVDYVGRQYHLFPKYDQMAREYFKNIPGPLPSVKDLENNASLVLLNTHYSFDVTMPLVPGIVHIGGAHIEPVKKLPENIQKFLDESKDGAIFFSLGSHAAIRGMEKEKQEAFFSVFGKIKQRVIMKWEDDNGPKIKNVLTGKWLPQNDILAHPNLKAFITHGGMLGTQEAMDKGVPVIGMPLFADQFLNIARLVHLGMGVELDVNTINENTIMKALNQVLNDPSYKQKAQELSLRFKDRQNSPLDTAVYWIEYVIRHKGAHFLKSPLANIPWYRYKMIDVIVLAILLIVTIVGTVFYVKSLTRRRVNKHHDKIIYKIKPKKDD